MKLIKRNIYKDLLSHAEKKEISLLTGPRQSGKTTLMNLMKSELEKDGKRTLFLNLDSEMDKNYFSSQQMLLKKIELEFGDKKGYIFIDEIQRKNDAGIFLKGLYDMNLPHKFIVSGSGSLELKEKIHESLVGRKRIFELGTVSFDEFVNFKTNYKYESELETFFELEHELINIYLTEYLNFGGYPRVILEKEQREKIFIINDIFHSYLEKDISYLLKVERIDAFSDLIKIISGRLGSLTNYSNIASEINISVQTLKNYLFYAEKTFILQKLTPYFKNNSKEIVKSPVYYFYDIGLRNFSINLFGNITDFGHVFENLVLNIIKEKIKFTNGSIHFWRTLDKAEVDFVLDFGKEIIPIEVKYKKYKLPKLEASLRSFIDKYAPKKAFVVNLELNARLNINNTNVYFIPVGELFKLNQYIE
ncbi:MAG: ATP-binding protein [Candidatus Acididesulfobacter diazotrophicus]|uniref:ATP-binding protein n=1 Tax=Candidatus Acididesulfobacter diazotrophicus TaxID=2597226 RepID=A0A519BK29_9DELT|nr:MAG: ATP-binding protein [Candidatus Acididesulfobacter diazotrophicus]